MFNRLCLLKGLYNWVHVCGCWLQSMRRPGRARQHTVIPTPRVGTSAQVGCATDHMREITK